MGTEYINDIGIGFPISDEQIPSKFRETKHEVNHFENRWDPKTGKKLPKEKVIDSLEEEVYVLDGRSYVTIHDFLSAVAKPLGCICAEYGDYVDGSLFYTIELRSVRPDGKESGPDGLAVCDLIKLLPKYYKVRNALRKMGIEVQDEPIIQLQETAG